MAIKSVNQRVTLTLTRDLIKKIDRYRAYLGMSRSAFVSFAVITLLYSKPDDSSQFSLPVK